MAEIIAVASGKGGVGKSFFAANLALSFLNSGKKVLLVDGDLGGANLHNFVGLKLPGKCLYNFIREKMPIQEVILETPAGVDFIGGAGDILGMAHINNFEKLKILNYLKKSDYDFVILDLGAGTSYNMIDFFNFSEKKILVMTSEPTSIENSYGFLKVSVYRKIEKELSLDRRFDNICRNIKSRSMNYQKISMIFEDVEKIDADTKERIVNTVKDFRVGIVLNMLRFKRELNVFFGFENVSEKYLSMSVEKIGFIPYDINVSDVLRKLVPFYNSPEGEQMRVFFDDVRDVILRKL